MKPGFGKAITSTVMSLVLAIGLTPAAAFATTGASTGLLNSGSAGLAPASTNLEPQDLQAQESGTWGNLTWAVSADGRLTISGTGAMDDFEYGNDVGWHSEANRENVTSVVIEPGVTSISNCAFQDFYNVESIQIPEGVTSIAYDAFYYCMSVTSIELPATLSEIDAGAFFGCSSLEEVRVSEGNEQLHSDTYGALYSGTVLLYYPEGATNKRFEIEPGATLDDMSNINNSSLEELVIPTSVTEVSPFFFTLPNMKKFEVAEGNESLFADEQGVLYSNGVEGVIYSNGEEGLTLIAYPQGKEDESYSVVQGTKGIGSSGFSMYGCGGETGARWNLKSIDLGNELESIGQNAFCDCLSLESLTIPASCTQIETGDVFRGCVSLQSFNVEEGNERYRSDDAGALYDASSKTLMHFPLGSPNTSVYAVSPGTLAVAGSAFAYDEWEDRYTVPGEEDGYLLSLPALKHIIIPSSVKSVEWGAFDRAWLDTVTVLSDDAEFNDPVGNGVNNNPVVRCMAGSTAKSWADGEGFETEIIAASDFQITGVAESYDYTGNEITPSVEVSKDGKLLNRFEGEYGLLFDGNVDGPVATVLVYGKGAYAGFATEQTFAVNGAPPATDNVDIADADVSIAPQVFTGESLSPSVVVKLGDKVLDATSDYTVLFDGAINAGTYEVVIEGQGAYSGQARGAFQITPKPVTVYALNASKTFGAADPQLKARVEGLVGSDTVSYSLSRKSGENVGSYAVTATGSASQGNYSVSFRSATFSISAATIEGKALVLSDSSFTYTGKAQKPSVNQVGGKKLKAGVDYTLEYSNENSKNAGQYTVWVVGKGNYAGTSAKASYRIEKAANPMKASAKTLRVKAKKGATFKKAKAFTITKAMGKLSFNKANKAGAKRITVSKDGKIVVKKGLAASTYKVKVKVTAKGTANYKKASKTLTLKIKVS